MRLEQVIVGHHVEWGKWPDTDDTDYAPILAKREEWQFGDLTIVNRYLPAYKCYLDAEMPGFVTPRFPWIENTQQPPDEVMAAQLTALEVAATECQSVLWEHSYQCHPPVAQHLQRLFRLAVLAFGDDCPGSSDVKTFPVAPCFDALMYTMFVWDLDAKRLTAPEYAARGLRRAYHIGTGPTLGLADELARLKFNVAAKAGLLRARWRPVTGLCWVGLGGGSNAMRQRAVEAMNRWPQIVPGIGPTRFHGISMRDGHLGVRDPLHQVPEMGAAIAPLYVGAALGVNLQQSSIFNSRLVDLWMCGVGQIMHDPCGELARYGIEPGQHYIPFDGTPEGILTAAREWIADPPRLADLIERAEAKGREFAATSSWTAAYARMYREHRGQLENGR